MANNVKVRMEKSKTFSALVYEINLFDQFNDDEQEKKLLKQYVEAAVVGEEIIDPSDYDYKSSSSFNCVFKKIEATDSYFIGRYGEIKDARYEFAEVNIPNKGSFSQLEITYQVFFIIDYSTKQLIFIYNKNAKNFANLLIKHIQKKNNIISITATPMLESDLIKKIRKSQKICSGIIFRKDSFENNLLNFMNSNFKYSKEFKKATLTVTFKEVDKDELINCVKNGNLSNIKLNIKNEQGFDELIDFNTLALSRKFKISLSPSETNNIEFIKEKLLEFIS